MNYHGFKTRKYTVADLSRLLRVDDGTIHAMFKRGVLDEPMLIIHRDRGRPKYVWLYHQVQPVFVWYEHLRNRSPTKTVRRYHADDIKTLTRMKQRMIMTFHRNSGIPRTDPYYSAAGKYGVIWPETVNDH